MSGAKFSAPEVFCIQVGVALPLLWWRFSSVCVFFFLAARFQSFTRFVVVFALLDLIPI